MKRKYARYMLLGVTILTLAGFSACQKKEQGNINPTPEAEPTVVLSPTAEPTAALQEPTSTPIPTPEPTNTPTPSPTPSPAATGELANVLAKAERMAAGYDYPGAIDYIKTYEGYEESEVAMQAIERFTELDKELVPLTKKQLENVPHIFFHSLIVDTARAFDGDGDSSGYNLYMTTIDEFNKMMQQMYEKGYVLVSPYDVAREVTDENGTRMTHGSIRLPEGKKPFVLSQDDVNYYSYMIGSGDGKGSVPAKIDRWGDGFATKIVIDENGKPACEYVDMDGNVSVGAYDMVPLIEQFVEEHPDFSYHGAKGILGLTGFEGVFGYRTKPSYETTIGTEAFQKEVEEAKKVTECLKENGWLIASHTFGHPDYGKISVERIKADDKAWREQVAPIVGETDLLIYPYGSDVNDWHRYTFENEKYSYLYESGYRYFYNVDGTAGWTQLSNYTYRGGRVNADGMRMWVNPASLKPFFDVETVFDPARPTPVE